MCYSAEVSFLTWGYGMACAAILYLSGNSPKSFLFPFIVVQMQLIEGLRWTHALPESILAPIAKGLLYAQPVAGLVEIDNTKWILPYVIAQTLVEVIGGSNDPRFVVAGDGHLSWKWLPELGSPVGIPYLLALFFIAFHLFPVWLNGILIALFVYYLTFHRQYGTWGSLWCVSVNILWLYYLTR